MSDQKTFDQNIFYVKICDLEFDIGMDSTLQKLGIQHFGKKAVGWRGPLQRMDQFKNVSIDVLPPIRVKKKLLFTPSRLKKQGIQNCSYEIIDGRHRTITAFINGHDKIQATLYS